MVLDVVVREYNYLGLYQHGDGGKIMMQDYQEHHQLLPIPQDLLVQEETYLGDMGGFVVVETVVLVIIPILNFLAMLVLVLVHIQEVPMVGLQVMALMDGVIGLLLALVVVEVVLEVHLLKEEKVVLVL